MEATARITSEGQITVPQAVRDALGLQEGDELVFRVEGPRAVVVKAPDFLALGGSFDVPAAKRNAAWDDVLHRTRVERAEDRR